MEKTKAEILFEISWEVCNKVGGINTVLRSKAKQIIKYYDSNYYVIGPYFANKVAGEFEEELPEEKFKKICEDTKNLGITLHFGKWLIKGSPKAILIDFGSFMKQCNEIKKVLWENFKIDSLNASHDYNEPLVWAYASGIVLEKLNSVFNKKIVAQFHEWLAGAGILYLKKNKVKIATIFTTHATVLGRTLSSSNFDLYGSAGNNKLKLETIDPEKEAYEHHVESKHQIEKEAAKNAEIFTTVSEITGMEATYILKRKPDVLLPNGLDMEKFPTFEDASIKHKFYRNIIKEFILCYFFPYYTFDIRDTLLFFLAGRYEFRDKGIDVYIKALQNLNERLKAEKSKKTVVAFIWVPANIRGINHDFLENKILFKDIKESISENMHNIQNSILYSVLSRKILSQENIFSKDFLEELKIKLAKITKKGTPSLSTHDLADPNDEILKNLVPVSLDNQEDDKVKVVFYPTYLNGADGLLDLTYYEAMAGCHLGVFPSFYEPWGYTPLEAAALGVSSVTTDLAGFGRFIMKKNQKKQPGIFVLKRLNRTDKEIIDDLSNFMYKFSQFSRQERVLNKIEAKRLSGLADWKKLISSYIEAQNLAIEKVFK
jgi:glycogen(starch) synthase